jgi:Polysaccharide lyase
MLLLLRRLPLDIVGPAAESGARPFGRDLLNLRNGVPVPGGELAPGVLESSRPAARIRSTLTSFRPCASICPVRSRGMRFALFLLVLVVLGWSTPQIGAAPVDPVRGVALAKAVPTFSLTVPPGGKEGGRSIAAHWFGVAGARLDAGADYWVIGGFYFPPGMPVVRDWGVVWNFHTVAGDVGWPIGVSPVQIDITDGLLHVLTHGGGSISTIDGIPQPVDVTRFDFPRSCHASILRGAWTDWVMHVKLDSKHGFVKLWQRGVLVVDARNVPTLYTGEQHAELWVGFYTNGAANPDSTFSMALEAPRIGRTFRAAAAVMPTVTAQWGSLQFDPSKVSRLQPRPPSDFVYPRTFTGVRRCVSGP